MILLNLRPNLVFNQNITTISCLFKLKYQWLISKPNMVINKNRTCFRNVYYTSNEIPSPIRQFQFQNYLYKILVRNSSETAGPILMKFREHIG